MSDSGRMLRDPCETCGIFHNGPCESVSGEPPRAEPPTEHGSDVCACGEYRSQHALDQQGRMACKICANSTAPYDGCKEFRFTRKATDSELQRWTRYHMDKTNWPPMSDKLRSYGAGPRPSAPEPKCGKYAAPFIAGGPSWACVLDSGHEGECRPGGTCFKHGAYVAEPNVSPQCPKWPDCISSDFETPEQIETTSVVWTRQPKSSPVDLQDAARKLAKEIIDWVKAGTPLDETATEHLAIVLAAHLRGK